MNHPGTQAQPRKHNHVVFEAAMSDTRAALAAWRDRPAPVVSRWLLGSLAIACSMLLAVWIVSLGAEQADYVYVGDIFNPRQFTNAVRVFIRNSLVLALHAFVCVAGFMAMSTLPAQAGLRHGFDRWIHHHAGRFAMLFVTAATLFSITTQVYVLGHMTADLSAALDVSQGRLLLTVLPHALLELTAVFLPLAAFMIASRRREWSQLLAATAVTVAIAVPMLIVAAMLEAYLWPSLLIDLVY